MTLTSVPCKVTTPVAGPVSHKTTRRCSDEGPEWLEFNPPTVSTVHRTDQWSAPNSPHDRFVVTTQQSTGQISDQNSIVHRTDQWSEPNSPQDRLVVRNQQSTGQISGQNSIVHRTDQWSEHNSPQDRLVVRTQQSTGQISGQHPTVHRTDQWSGPNSPQDRSVVSTQQSAGQISGQHPTVHRTNRWSGPNSPQDRSVVRTQQSGNVRFQPQYVGISTYQFIPYYASAIHTHTRILKPFEDSEPTGLKVDIASSPHGQISGQDPTVHRTDQWSGPNSPQDRSVVRTQQSTGQIGGQNPTVHRTDRWSEPNSPQDRSVVRTQPTNCSNSQQTDQCIQMGLEDEDRVIAASYRSRPVFQISPVKRQDSYDMTTGQ